MEHNSWSTPIGKLMLWRANSWIKSDANVTKLLLKVHYDQLFIVSDSKILESFNMRCKIKVIYKDDVVILIVSNANCEIRKIKFQFKSDAGQWLQRLGKHFPVVSYKSTESNSLITSKYRNLNDVLKYALEEKGNEFSPNLPSAYNNFVKLCLLDPTFPQMVKETEKILEHEFLKK